VDWLELYAEAAGENVETLCAVLADLAAGGLSIEEPLVPLGPEEGVRLEPWRPTIVRLYLPEDRQLSARREAVRSAVAGLDFPVDVRVKTVREEDWANGWKEFFHVEHIGRRLVIRPAWRAHTPAPEEIVLDLDPGMAFGTGQHETTRMCLTALQELDLTGRSVLDLGCGAGILAIAAAKLGAARVLAADIDSVAVEATVANAVRNGVSEVVLVGEGSLGPSWPFQEPLSRQVAAFDVILVNIHAGALIALAEAFYGALRPGGVLIASGVIGERYQAVVDALLAEGFWNIHGHNEGEWWAITAAGARKPK